MLPKNVNSFLTIMNTLGPLLGRLGNFFSGERSEGEKEGGEKAKGFSGLFGYADERQFWQYVRSLVIEDKLTKEQYAKLIGFYKFCFEKYPDGLVREAVRFIFMNRHRDFIVGLANTAEQDDREATVTTDHFTYHTDDAGNAKKTKKKVRVARKYKTKVDARGTNYRKEFILWMIETIEDGESTSSKRTNRGKLRDGYRFLVEEMRSGDIPGMPPVFVESIAKWIHGVISMDPDEMATAVNAYRKHVQNASAQISANSANNPLEQGWHGRFRKIVNLGL